MKNRKLKLEELQVKSFITDKSSVTRTIKGGWTALGCNINHLNPPLIALPFDLNDITTTIATTVSSSIVFQSRVNC